jgi:hypothetical protein
MSDFLTIVKWLWADWLGRAVIAIFLFNLFAVGGVAWLLYTR